MTPTFVTVLAAVIERDGRLLICQRPKNKRHGQRWEFPGGKLLPGEDLRRAARRELREELGLEVTTVGRLLFDALDPGSRFLIRFVEVDVAGTPQALEHEQLAWVYPTDLVQYDLAPSDRTFVLQHLLKGAVE